MRLTNVAEAYKYAHDVVSGKIDTCVTVIQACHRFFLDIEKAKAGNWEYRLDECTAERVLMILQQFQHIKGPLAGTPLFLSPWQKFILLNIFGWLSVETGFRRFRIVYTEVPRGQGKSALSSAIALYMLALDGEGGPEVYSAATTRDQAKIVFKTAQQMARRAESFREKFGVFVRAHDIVCPRNAGEFIALSADGRSLDGLHTHLAVVDELHAHPTREVYDVMETSIGKRDQSMLWTITTAGTNITGICYEQHRYVTQILDGTVQDENYFGIIYSADEGDDWLAESTWKKANPNWGISVMPPVIAQLANKATKIPSAQNNFKTKHLDIWCTASSPWMPADKWRRNAHPESTIPEFRGKKCILALDLASRTDIAALIYIFYDEPSESASGKLEFTVFGQYYLPSSAIEESNNASYAGWMHSGLLSVTPGEVTDFTLVQHDIKAARENFEVICLAYDPWQATHLAQTLEDEGMNCIEVRPTPANFSNAMKELYVMTVEGRVRHDGSPVLEWMLANVVAKEDDNGNIMPKKERKDAKIDGAVALMMGASVLVNSSIEEEVIEGPSVYAEREMIVL